jgi:hypothetical protein
LAQAVGPFRHGCWLVLLLSLYSTKATCSAPLASGEKGIYRPGRMMTEEIQRPRFRIIMAMPAPASRVLAARELYNLCAPRAMRSLVSAGGSGPGRDERTLSRFDPLRAVQDPIRSLETDRARPSVWRCPMGVFYPFLLAFAFCRLLNALFGVVATKASENQGSVH